MTQTSPTLGFALLWLLLGGVGLATGAYAIAWLTEIAPIGQARRRWVRRVRAPAALVVIGGYALIAGVRVVSTQTPTVAAVLTVLLLAVGATVFGMLRDVLAGVVLKSTGVCQLGAALRTQGAVGRVTGLGLRTLTLTTSNGDRIVAPYSRVASEPLWLTTDHESLASRCFILRQPPEVGASEFIRQTRELVLLNHWVVWAKPPLIQSVEDGIEVTLFAIEETRAPEVEQQVRRSLSEKRMMLR